MIPTTGTGTETDPYVIAEWEDFVTHAAEEGVYITIVPNTVWDMNVLHPEAWNSTAVAIKAKYINGNGVEIRNAYFENCDFMTCATTVSVEKYYYNMKFLNCFGRNTSANKRYVFNCTTEYTHIHCSEIVVTGSFYSTNSSGSIQPTNVNIYRNSWNLFVYGGFDFPTAGINTCNFFVVNKNNTKDVSYQSMYNSLIEGEFYSLYHKSSEQNIINATITNTLKTYSTNNFTIVNSDKVAEGVTIPSNFISVTDEEMKDAEYLRSLGFPIGG